MQETGPCWSADQGMALPSVSGQGLGSRSGVLTVWWFGEILILWTVNGSRWWELRWAVYCSDFCDWSESGLNNREFMIAAKTKLTLSYSVLIYTFCCHLTGLPTPDQRLWDLPVHSRDGTRSRLHWNDFVRHRWLARQQQRNFLGFSAPSLQGLCFNFGLHREVISRQRRWYRK